jgi:pimeloyl-ACP methyl ester carboxylesterase
METISATEGISVRRIDIPMRWIERGEGLPLVLIHGIPTGLLLWREVLLRLAGARCLAWEMVGYGASMPAGRERDISISAQADYLALWLKHLGISRAVLAGHCLGGAVAQVAALRYPGLCAGLFLIDALGYDSWPPALLQPLRRCAE